MHLVACSLPTFDVRIRVVRLQNIAFETMRVLVEVVPNARHVCPVRTAEPGCMMLCKLADHIQVLFQGMYLPVAIKVASHMREKVGIGDVLFIGFRLYFA